MFSDKKNKGRVPFRPAPERNLGHDPSGAGQAPRFLRAWWRVATILLLLTGTLNAAFASSYVYDANGRLTAATAPGGGTVQYTYDSLGNILSVQPVTSGQLAVFSFSPEQGPVGSQVTLEGSGFSPTSGNDTVSFNGTAATVVSATDTQLVVTVPSGATTGPVSITVGTSSVTSSSDFTVVQTGAPVITAFSPGVADIGTSITVSGNNLDPIPGLTTASLGGTAVTVTSISNTQIVFSVPSAAASGPIQVSTPYGEATSNTDLIVAPSAIGAVNIASSADLAPNGIAQTLSIGTSNQYGVFAFNATAGQWLSLQLTSLSVTASGGQISYTVYSRNNIQIASGWVSSASNMSIHLPEVLTTGTYLVAFDSGSGTAQLSASLEQDTILVANTPAVSVTTSVAGQSKRLIFSATQGQNLGLGINTTYGIDVAIYNPNGTGLTSTPCSASNSCGINLANLPQNGTYQMVVQPSGATQVSFQATLSTDVTGTLSTGTALNLNLAQPGQIGLMNFTATAGETLALTVNGISTTPANNIVQIQIQGPSFNTYQNVSGPNYIFNLPNLSAGTYTVSIVPNNAATASMQLETVPGVTGTLTTTGGASSFSTSTPGQNVYLSFSATQGQNLGLGITNVAVSPSSAWGIQVIVYDHNGNVVANGPCCAAPNGGVGLDLRNLPAGTYEVLIEPGNTNQTMSFQATLSTDVTGTLSTGTALNLNLAQPGQIGLMNFTATAGETLALTVNGISTTPANNIVQIQIQGPSFNTYQNVSGPNYIFNLPNLSAGTYTVSIVPNNAATASMQLETVPGVTGTLTTTGGASSFSTSTPGQNVYLSFSATQGQNLGLGITNVAVSPSSAWGIQVIVYDHNGNVVANGPCCAAPNGGVGLDLRNLPAGTYEVLIEPGNTNQTMSFQASLAVAGDLNDDGVVDNADVLLAERIALGLVTPTPLQQVAGDVAPLVNGIPAPDGVINFQDVLLIQRKALGLVQY
ncbi:MAG: beta strand repeat-containing protein [Acidiferrobacteraceae bacterium]